MAKKRDIPQRALRFPVWDSFVFHFPRSPVYSSPCWYSNSPNSPQSPPALPSRPCTLEDLDISNMRDIPLLDLDPASPLLEGEKGTFWFFAGRMKQGGVFLRIFGSWRIFLHAAYCPEASNKGMPHRRLRT